MTLSVPTVHLNGTSRDALMAEMMAAIEAVRNAETALNAMTWHARDFYVQPDGAWEVAREQQRQRALALDTVRVELEVICEAVFDQRR